MTETDREELKEQLRAMVAGRGDGIDLDTPSHWVIEGLKQPIAFFEHLTDLLPPDSILYVEGTGIVAEVLQGAFEQFGNLMGDWRVIGQRQLLVATGDD